MQAAAHRLPRTERQRRADNLGAKPHIATADDTGLLDALPIAAAIVELGKKGALKVCAHNGRFFDTIQRSTCRAEDWNEADCLKSGPIADLLRSFFDGSDVTGELDLKDGEGVSARYLRVKLAPLPRSEAKLPRCLLSL